MLKKKWWLVAIIGIAGFLFMKESGYMDPAAKQVLEKQGTWEMTMKIPGYENDPVYVKFDHNTMGMGEEDRIRNDDPYTVLNVSYTDKKTMAVGDATQGWGGKTPFDRIEFDTVSDTVVSGYGIKGDGVYRFPITFKPYTVKK